MKYEHEFVIDRSEWLPRESQDEMNLESRLRNGGRYCCVGVYLKSLGVSDRRMGTRYYSRELVRPPLESGKLSIRHASGLTYEGELTLANDCRWIDRTERESRIRKLFREIGVKVTFRGRLK